MIASFTVSLSLPQVIGICGFCLPFLIGAIAAVVKRDKFFLIPGSIIGVVIGLLGWIVGHPIDANIEANKARQAAHEQRQSYYDTMSDDWKELYQSLKTTDSIPARKLKVSWFLEEERSKMSIDAWEVFYSTATCDQYSWDVCNNWKSWLAEQLSPYVSKGVAATLPDADQ